MNISIPTLEDIKAIVIEALEECKSKGPPTTTYEVILNIEQAAKFLHLSVKTLYRYVHDNSIPVHKKQRRLYFIPAELLEWVKSGKRYSRSDVEAATEEIFLTRQFRRQKHPLKQGRIK